MKYGEYREGMLELPEDEEVQVQGRILHYSALYQDDEGAKFCTVSMPVYDKAGWSYRKQIGVCVLLLNVDSFQNMLGGHTDYRPFGNDSRRPGEPGSCIRGQAGDSAGDLRC